MFPHPETGEATTGIAKVRYSHDAMIDLLIAEPSIKQNDIAVHFDRSVGWISQVINSDAFQARLADRKAALVDPVIVAAVKDRLSAVAGRSLELIQERLNQPLASTMLSDDFLLKTADLATKALGYGARSVGSSQTNIAVVVQVPPKIASATEWATIHAPA